MFARDGIEALETLKANSDIDLVVSDINMPRMDGLTLLQKLQDSDAGMSTIIVSAYGDMANIRTAMNRGAFDFVTKPIDFADLETTIAKTLRHVESLREARRRQAEAERAHASLSRYFSPNLALRLAGERGAGELEGQRREIATLFTDITSFTALVEALEPSVPRAAAQRLSDRHDRYRLRPRGHSGKNHRRCHPCAVRCAGRTAGPRVSRRGLRAGARRLCAGHFASATGRKVLALGLTRIGAARRASDRRQPSAAATSSITPPMATPSMSRRVWKRANKQLGTRICVSATLASKVENFKGRPVGDLSLRGKTEALRTYEPMRPEQYESPATKSYLDAFAKLEANDPAAVAAFAAHLGKEPGDQLASFHLKRLLNGATVRG